MDKKSLRILEFDKILDRLAGYTRFSASEALARELEPTSNLEEAVERQEETNEARILLDMRTDLTIAGARDVRQKVHNTLRGFILSAEELLDVRATIIAGRNLNRKLVGLNEDFPKMAEIGALIEECPGLVSAIGQTLDERGEVLDSASVKLASVRRELQIAHGRIQEKLRALLSSSQNQYLQEPIITSRGGRYVVPLKADYKGRIKGIVHDQSGSGATLWIEPFNTVDLNNKYRSLQLAEEEEIQRILAELSAEVAVQGDSIIRVVDRLAELDLIFARARYASHLEAIMPEFVPWRVMTPPKPPKHDNELVKWQPPEYNPHPGSTIWLRGARHPLLDPDNVVPTDLLLDDETFLVLITGPNTGGKTVSLKTIGLMVLMAQAGLQIPVLQARLTIFEQVFADIGDEQSIEQNLSTFSSHLTNIVRILERANDRSLVLLDELGSGTDPAEGAALAQAIVNYLRDLGSTTFVATHYPELKLYASQTPGATNASLLFDVETLMPTYEMSIGMPGRSNAFAIGRRLGLSDEVLDEAMRLVGTGSNKAETLLDSIYEIREKISSQEAGTRLALEQAKGTRDSLLERLENTEVEKKQILEESRQTGAAELKNLRREIRQIRRQLKDTESLNKLKKLQKQSEQAEDQLEIRLKPDIEPLKQLEAAKRRRRNQSNLQVGDTVFVTTLGAKGKIVSLDKKEAEVAVGRLHMRARFDELELREREAVEETIPDAVLSPKKSPGMELDIRGRRVEEGLADVEQYLDAAFLARLPWVRIIHGKGTGRLRDAVREALKSNAHASSWEEGQEGEGGSGVTVVKLESD